MVTPRLIAAARRSAVAALVVLSSCSSAGGEPRLASTPQAAAPPATPEPQVPAAATHPVPSAISQVPADPPPPADPAPLADDARAVFLGSPEDEPPVELGGVTAERKNQHYVSSNERTLEAFHPRIRGLRGGYLGVGSDQSYLLIGWARSELAWLIDYDPVVVDVHAVYHALFAAADTPAAFRDLWRVEHKAAAVAAIKARYEPREARRRELLYRRYRARIAKRLDAVIAGMTAAGVPCFLTDDGQYAYVRDLVRQGRVRSLVADLTQTTAVRQLAAAAERLATPIRVVYLSNAEEYWNTLPANFRDNIAALHVDDSSVVLRTLLTWEKNQDYRYNAQSARKYKQWLAQPWVRTIYDVVRRKQFDPAEVHFFETDALPDEQAYRERQSKRALAQTRAADKAAAAAP
ncbi:MAG: hypothetical protein JNL82_07050 [Myxococcales bacterium]|nr:hypothetical protein [Myxococcales bacterium]